MTVTILDEALGDSNQQLVCGLAQQERIGFVEQVYSRWQRVMPKRSSQMTKLSALGRELW